MMARRFRLERVRPANFRGTHGSNSRCRSPARGRAPRRITWFSETTSFGFVDQIAANSLRSAEVRQANLSHRAVAVLDPLVYAAGGAEMKAIATATDPKLRARATAIDSRTPRERTGTRLVGSELGAPRPPRNTRPLHGDRTEAVWVVIPHAARVGAGYCLNPRQGGLRRINARGEL
jgi:hypothetical protein